MAEAIINPSTLNLRSKGISSSMGRIHKGCVKDATTKLSIGSIPSTYESIIYKSDNKLAFGTSEKRFYEIENMSTLAGNSQDASIFDNLPSEHKVNHNRQGQNAFVSKLKRDCFRTIRTPGPAHYQRTHQNISQVEPRKCVTRQTRKHYRNQKKQNSEEAKQIPSPGPGEYIYDRHQFWNTSNKGWRSSFETKLGRDAYIQDNVNPGPGCYNLQNERKIKHMEKKDSHSGQKKQNFNVLQDTIQQTEQPGPGSYSQEIPTFKPLYQRIKMSGNFMASVFTGKRKNKGSPGPTAYVVKRMYDDVEPKLIESTCFMSEVKREVFKQKEGFGPNQVPPNLLGHKNFHFNIKNDWIC